MSEQPMYLDWADPEPSAWDRLCDPEPSAWDRLCDPERAREWYARRAAREAS